MRAITLHQPWASLIAIGAKPFETRSFPPPARLIGQRIAIHAAAREPKMTEIAGLHTSTGEWAGASAGIALDLLEGELWRGCPLPLGAVVCTAVISGAYHVFPVDGGGVKLLAPVGMGPRLPPEMIHHTDPFGDYTPGRWCWNLTDVQPLAVPEPAKGKQGWWEWEPMCPAGGRKASDCAAEGSCGCTIGKPVFGPDAHRLLAS